MHKYFQRSMLQNVEEKIPSVKRPACQLRKIYENVFNSQLSISEDNYGALVSWKLQGLLVFAG